MASTLDTGMSSGYERGHSRGRPMPSLSPVRNFRGNEENQALKENIEELRKINNDAFTQLTEAHTRLRELETADRTRRTQMSFAPDKDRRIDVRKIHEFRSFVED